MAINNSKAELVYRYIPSINSIPRSRQAIQLYEMLFLCISDLFFLVSPPFPVSLFS